jgi:hypothetical protein
MLEKCYLLKKKKKKSGVCFWHSLHRSRNTESCAEMAEEEVEKAHHSESESEKKTSMTPWEQHSGVISIPRYDYKAPTSLLHHSLSGFLITCTIS